MPLRLMEMQFRQASQQINQLMELFANSRLPACQHARLFQTRYTSYTGFQMLKNDKNQLKILNVYKLYNET